MYIPHDICASIAQYSYKLSLVYYRHRKDIPKSLMTYDFILYNIQHTSDDVLLERMLHQRPLKLSKPEVEELLIESTRYNCYVMLSYLLKRYRISRDIIQECISLASLHNYCASLSVLSI